MVRLSAVMVVVAGGLAHVEGGQCGVSSGRDVGDDARHHDRQQQQQPPAGQPAQQSARGQEDLVADVDEGDLGQLPGQPHWGCDDVRAVFLRSILERSLQEINRRRRRKKLAVD